MIQPPTKNVTHFESGQSYFDKKELHFKVWKTRYDMFTLVVVTLVLGRTSNPKAVHACRRQPLEGRLVDVVPLAQVGVRGARREIAVGNLARTFPFLANVISEDRVLKNINGF